MPWQTTIQLQGQTYLGCGVSLNCMWSLSLESKRRERIPHACCATPCMGTFTQGLKKSGRPQGGNVPCRSSTLIPTATQYILYTVQVSLAGVDEYSILTASMADM